MKKLFNIALNFGLREELSPHDRRKIKTVNFLNMLVAFFLVLGFSNFIILKADYPFISVSIFLFASLFSLFLSYRHLTKMAFAVFSINVNLSIFYINQKYPLEAGSYLYYFPLIVTVVLLNNPTFRDKDFIFHSIICIIGFACSMFLDVASISKGSFSFEITQSLWYTNMIMSAVITGILSFLLNRLILQQNNEILVQNSNLTVAKEAVNASLKEKEILLAELHHRVKNNLAIISGLLNLQDDATENEEAKEIIGDSKSRIMSMALVHRMLYENSELKNLDLGQYASVLIHELFNSYDLSRKINIVQEYDKVILPVSLSVPLGLIINEIVTNSIKYVFKSPNKEKANFFISIREKNNLVHMLVQDDGPGFPEDFNPDGENISLGIFLIKTLSEQIDGEIKFSNQNGAKIELKFPLN